MNIGTSGLEIHSLTFPISSNSEHWNSSGLEIHALTFPISSHSATVNIGTSRVEINIFILSHISLHSKHWNMRVCNKLHKPPPSLQALLFTITPFSSYSVLELKVLKKTFLYCVEEWELLYNIDTY